MPPGDWYGYSNHIKPEGMDRTRAHSAGDLSCDEPHFLQKSLLNDDSLQESRADLITRTGNVGGTKVTFASDLLVKSNQTCNVSYESFGGEGYISPGRRNHHPSTDYTGGPRTIKPSKQLLYVAISLLVTGVVGLLIFFLVPRSITLSPLSCRQSGPYLCSQNKSLRLEYQEVFLINNPNYAPLTITDMQISATFMKTVDDPGVYIGNLSRGEPYVFAARVVSGEYYLNKILNTVLTDANWDRFLESYFSVCTGHAQDPNSFYLGFVGEASASVLAVGSAVPVAAEQYKMQCPDKPDLNDCTY